MAGKKQTVKFVDRFSPTGRGMGNRLTDDEKAAILETATNGKAVLLETSSERTALRLRAAIHYLANQQRLCYHTTTSKDKTSLSVYFEKLRDSIKP